MELNIPIFQDNFVWGLVVVCGDRAHTGRYTQVTSFNELLWLLSTIFLKVLSKGVCSGAQNCIERERRPQGKTLMMDKILSSAEEDFFGATPVDGGFGTLCLFPSYQASWWAMLKDAGLLGTWVNGLGAVLRRSSVYRTWKILLRSYFFCRMIWGQLGL